MCNVDRYMLLGKKLNFSDVHVPPVCKILWCFVTFTPYQKSYMGEKHIGSKWTANEIVKIIENIVAISNI